MEPKADYLFESSWEVCNKVGGIYTVVKSKSSAMQQFYENYFLIGPYFQDKADQAFEEQEAPDFLKKAFSDMEKLGVKCHYGKWMVEKEPSTILVDFMNYNESLDDIKKFLWDKYKVNSINASWDFNQPLQWSWAVGKLMEKVDEYLGKMKVVLHCHEWLSGFPILYLHSKKSNIKTVFTTHATMLGRTIAGNGQELYDVLDDLNPDEEAKKWRVEEKYTTEKACAKTANVFTTVSEITAIEAEKILGKKADVLLNNGMNTDKFPTIEETTLMHVKNRDLIREFVSYYFFPYYQFDLDHNMIYYIVGRYEFKNKGLDILIESLKKLNEELKEKDDERTVTMFFWVPMSNKGINEEVMENKSYYNHIKTTLDRNEKSIMSNLLHDMLSKNVTADQSMFTSSVVKDLKKDIKNFHREGKPPLCTHNLVDYDDNAVIQALKKAGLDNSEESKVKVIVYPVYLDGNDRLLDLTYYEALSAGHLGIFPSYYEPWGYTPVESISLGVAAVTTDLAGFGRFIKPHLLDENPGLFVLDRFEKSQEESIEGLYQILSKYSNYDHAQRVQNKINAKQMSILNDWKHFVKNYIEAHNKALKK